VANFLKYVVTEVVLFHLLLWRH